MQLRTLRQTFIRTITTGPVLIIAPMRTPDHSKTKLPLVESSPLVRLALLATNLGATDLVFNARERHAAIIYLLGHGSLETMQTVVNHGQIMPAVGFRWCELNGGFFCDEIVVWGERLSPWVPALGQPGDVAHALELGGPRSARFDEVDMAHARCVEQVAHYFQAQDWTSALESLLPPKLTACPVDAGPGALQPPATASRELQSEDDISDPTPQIDPADVRGMRFGKLGEG